MQVLIEATTSRDQFRPTLPIYMNIKTEGKSLVGLMAVDQSVYYLRNESRLTNKKVISFSQAKLLDIFLLLWIHCIEFKINYIPTVNLTAAPSLLGLSRNWKF